MGAGVSLVWDQKLAGPVGVVLTRVTVMDWSTVLRAIDEVLASQLGWADTAARVAALIREAGQYRWVGLYAVADQAITVIGWSGPGAPAHPRFPVTQGLSGTAVATKRAVLVNDVTADPRYLTAFASTLSEAIIPVLDPGTGRWSERWMRKAANGPPSPMPTVRRWRGAPPRSRI
jgi:putative methionine-R-sulfoxide reductase with GAF domain